MTRACNETETREEAINRIVRFFSRDDSGWMFAVYEDPSVRDQVADEVLSAFSTFAGKLIVPYEWKPEDDDYPGTYRLKVFREQRPDVTGIILVDFDAAAERMEALIQSVNLNRERIRSLEFRILFLVSYKTLRRFISDEGDDFYDWRVSANAYF